MSWNFLPADAAFKQYRGLWDDLNKANGNHLLLDTKFVELLLKHFGSRNTTLCVSKNPRNQGIVLLEKCGVGYWQTFQPSQAPLGLILFQNKNEVEKQMSGLMRSLPGYILGLGILQQDPDFSQFSNLAKSHTLEILEYITTSRQILMGTFEEYWGCRSKNLTHNLSRQRRRIQEKGITLELSTICDPNRVANSIEKYAWLEETGWRGKEGTAVSLNNAQGLFYREMLELFCKQEEAVIYQLLMNNTVVASDLCLKRDETLIILKIAYDENCKGYSPGLLLHQEILQALFSDGTIKVIEFYGRFGEWHKKWTDQVRSMFHVNFYRSRWIFKARQFSKNISKLLTKRHCLWV